MREPIEKGKCATTKEEYINAAVSQIENDSDKHEAALELAAHIDDRIEYYKEIGFDEAQAAQKAVEQMGDPDAVAVPLSRLHPKGRVWTTVLAVLSLGLAAYILWLYMIFIGNDFMGIGILEFLSLLYFNGLSLFGKKRKSSFWCGLSMYVFGLICLLRFTIGPHCSSILLSFFCLVTGDFDCLNTFTEVSGITVAPWLTFATCVFYVLVFIILIWTYISVTKLRKSNYSLSDRKRSRIISVLQKSILLFSALVVSISLCCRRPASPTNALGYEPKPFDAVVVLQSDKPCSVEEVRQEDIRILRVNWDLFSRYIETLECEDDGEMHDAFETKKEFVQTACGRKLKYKVQKDIIYPEITKPYVYIGFVDSGTESIHGDNLSDFIVLTQEDWQEADSVAPICAASDSYNVVEVVINAS